jgi:hypothetical protein
MIRGERGEPVLGNWGSAVLKRWDKRPDISKTTIGSDPKISRDATIRRDGRPPHRRDRARHHKAS